MMCDESQEPVSSASEVSGNEPVDNPTTHFGY